MKKINLLLLLPILCSCEATLEKPKYVESDKYYRIIYNLLSIEYKEDDFIYFKDKKVYENKLDPFEFRVDDNNYIYNYETHKIWGKFCEDGLVIRYVNSYDSDFKIRSIYGNISYFNLIGVSI